MLSDLELEQYSRQLLLPDFTLEQQARLRAARVLIVGCGGLGGPLAIYLAAAGIGELVLADGDRVERSNLHRQPLFCEPDIGLPKALAARAFIAGRYPHCRSSERAEHLAGDALLASVAGVDLVADASDNYPTRYAINRACIRYGKPLVSAAAVRSEGYLATFHSAPDGPCYRCLYPQEGEESALSCRDSGVMGPVVGVLGALQALEVLKVLSGWGDSAQGSLLTLDLASYAQQKLGVQRRSNCPDCGVDALGQGAALHPQS